MNIHALSMALWVIVLVFKNILYWLCIYTFWIFFTLHCRFSRFIKWPLQWSESSLFVDSLVWDFYQSCHSFPCFVFKPWGSLLCHDFLQLVFFNVYRFVFLCSEVFGVKYQGIVAHCVEAKLSKVILIWKTCCS